MQQNGIGWSTIGDLIVPLILVAIGLGFILRSNNRKSRHTYENDERFCDCQNAGSYTAEENCTQSSNFKEESNSYTGGKVKDISAIFGSRKVTYQNETFTGASINAIFGGACLDLRNASMSGNIEISASAIFGGIDILVPGNVCVVVNSVPIFGGVSNKAMSPVGDVKASIHVNATCMFGGIDIK